MSVRSKYHPHSFWLFCALGSLDLLIDKQELMRNKVLKANGLCSSDTINVSVRRQFEGKILGLHEPKQWDSKGCQLEKLSALFYV